VTVSQINNEGYITTKEQEANLKRLAFVVTELEELMEKEFLVTSGLRTPQDQLRINPGKKNSAHLSGEAVDVSDVDGSIYGFCIDNVDILIHLGIYLECKPYTPRWTHIQIRAPKSGHRFFTP
jgi:hypothetical protein